MKPERVFILFDSHTPYLSFRVNALQEALILRKLDEKIELHVVLIGAGWSTYGWGTDELQKQYHVPLHVLSPEFHGLGLKKLFHPSVPGNCWRLLKLLFKLRPKMLLAGGYDRAEGIFSLLLSYLLRFKIGVMNDSRFNDMESYSKSIWLELVKSLIIGRYDFFMVSGRESADYHRFTGGTKKPVYTQSWNVVDNQQIALAADQVDYDTEIYSCFNLEHGSPFFFFPARFVEKKNHHKTLKAYAEYAQKTSDAWPLVLCGQGPLKEEIQTSINTLNLQHKVRLCDWLPYEQMPRACRLAAAVLLPSHFDQWGMTVNEALAAGTPVLVSNRCGAHELVQNHLNGYTFAPDDAQHLASLFYQLHSDSALLPRLRGNCASSMQRFSIDQYVENHLQLFSQYMPD